MDWKGLINEQKGAGKETGIRYEMEGKKITIIEKPITIE